MAKSVASAAAKYLRGVQQGADNWAEGINQLTQSPMDAAIAAAPLWEQKMNEAIANKSWQTGLARMPFSTWKQKTLNAKSKYSGSAPQAAAAWTAFANKAAPVWEQAKQSAKQMPKGTMEDSLSRVRENMKIMSQLRGVRG